MKLIKRDAAADIPEVAKDGHQLFLQDPSQDPGGRRRGRRGKPLSKMTAGEVRRAMWLAPVAAGTAALAGLARIGVAAIQETLPLRLAVLLAVPLVVWPAITARKARRRHRARLIRLQSGSADFESAAEPLAPLPKSVRAWLVAAPLFALGALTLAATSPGAGSTCVDRGISTSAAREGTCVRAANLFGHGVTYYVVDAGHVLDMPGADVELLATTTQPVVITDPQRRPNFYPSGVGTLVSFEVAITNRGSTPLTYDANGTDVDLLLQDPQSPSHSYALIDQPGVGHEPIPALADQPPVQPGHTTVGWVAFDAPAWAPETLNSRATDLEFRLPADGNPTKSRDSYVGQIRLWRAANAAGARALTDKAAS
jgi:hypothetical protein